ncbi:hypothetical protein C8J57DRAFT_1465579, partial [Mycena rebaudengoi]
SAVAAPTPAHDANLTFQPSYTRLSATILRVIRAPPAASLRVVLPHPTSNATGILRPRARACHYPPGRFSRTGEGETSCAPSAAVWISFVGEPPDPAFLFELPPTDSVNAELARLVSSTTHPSLGNIQQLLSAVRSARATVDGAAASRRPCSDSRLHVVALYIERGLPR